LWRYKLNEVCDTILIPNEVFFLNQQFITQSARADHGSYFVTMYIKTKTTWRNKKRKRKEKNKQKRTKGK